MRADFGLIQGGRKGPATATLDQVLARKLADVYALEQFLGVDQEGHLDLERWGMLCGGCGLLVELASPTVVVLCPPICEKCQLPLVIVEKRLVLQGASA